MTAIGLYLYQEGVCAFSDGIAYDEAGIVRQIHSKQLVLTACNTVMVASGSGSALHFVRTRIEDEAPASFDEIDARMPAWSREVHKHLCGYFGRASFVILYGGWSEARRAWAGRLIATEIMGHPDGSDAAPFTPVEIAAFAKPLPDEAALRAQGLPAPDPWPAYATMPAAEFGTRLMLAQRASPMQLHHGGDLRGYGVGGFIEYTDLRRDRCETRILVRWDDRIGERADPAAA